MEKTISVPVQYYQLIASIALDKLSEMESAQNTGQPIPLAESICWGRLNRWAIWNAQADELGLTRLE